jgi:outer membrane protein assembly factor BamA
VLFRRLLAWITVSLLASLCSWSARARAQVTADAGAQTVAQVPTSTSTEQPASTLVGKPVVAIRSELVGEAFRDTALPTIAVPPGATYTPEFARATLRAALDSGRFASGDVAAEADANGVRLVLKLTPRKTLQDILVVAGDATLETDQLLRELELSRDQEVTDDTLRDLASRAAASMRRRGYADAKARIVLDKGSDATRLVLKLIITPGVCSMCAATHKASRSRPMRWAKVNASTKRDSTSPTPSCK